MYNLKNVEKYLSKEEMKYCIDILHKYDENVDDSHNSHHIIPVINTMMQMYYYHKKCVNMKMCIFIALLHDVGLYDDYYTLISCPTCGRTQANTKKIATSVMNLLEKYNKIDILQ